MKKIGVNVVSLVNKIASKVTWQEEMTAVATLSALQKEARKALRENASWDQDFHGNELVALIAMLPAARKVLSDKEAALGKAIAFIGSLELDRNYGLRAIQTLEDINQILVGESISETLSKKNGN